jgi:3-deoxy-7-phosphoheptulonate synthase
MIIVMKHKANAKQVASVVSRVEDIGYRAHLSEGEERTIIGVIGDERPIDLNQFELMEGVEKVLQVLHPFKLPAREMHPQNTVVALNGVKIGGPEVVVIAGPCSVESREQLIETAHAVKEAGGTALRGGVFKPRTSPYSFQGLGEQGLEYLAEAKEATGLPIVTEAMTIEQVALITRYVDVIQIGTRNMQNFPLLTAVGESGHSVLLKRGMMSTIEEWLMAADYILSKNNPNVILCERGIRTFEKATRSTTDINAIPVVKELTHLPIVLDPSHSTGKSSYVNAVARAGIAAGADGLIVEVHLHPEKALSDGAQSIKPETFAQLVKEAQVLSEAMGRKLAKHA